MHAWNIQNVVSLVCMIIKTVIQQLSGVRGKSSCKLRTDQLPWPEVRVSSNNQIYSAR